MVADASETESAEIVDTLLHDLPQEHGGKKVRVKVHEGEGCNFYWVDGLGADAVSEFVQERIRPRLGSRVALSWMEFLSWSDPNTNGVGRWYPIASPRAKRGSKKTNSMLRFFGSLIPRKNREAITGDLIEDVQEYRERGWTEKQIRRHLWWQFAIIVVKGVFRLGS